MKKVLKNKLLIIICMFFALTMFIVGVHSEPLTVIAVNDENAVLEVIDNGEHGGGKREVMVNINDIKPGKRITNFEICYQSEDCTDDNNWSVLNDADGYVSAYIGGVGNNAITIGIKTPTDPIKIRAKFTDFEAFSISYAKYNLSTDDENKYRDVYVDGTKVRENYDESFTNIVTGYMGGDIILPSGCTNNGCLLKITITNQNYENIINRLNDFNNNHNADNEKRSFLDLASMNNHLSELPIDSITPIEDNNGLVIESNEMTKSFYLIVNKFFSEKNRADFVIGENQNRFLSEDYIGLKYKVDRKFFDEGNNYGFLSFNDFNEYKQEAVIFYGTPSIQLGVDEVRPAALTNTGYNGMGTLKNVYDKIVSRDQDKYPISNTFELTIKSFYEQDYLVPITLKKGSNTVKDITLNLSRFAFGGNAGSLLLVDNNGINCKQSWMNPNCSGNNIYVSTEYRGLYDTFYSTGESIDSVDAFEISTQEQGLTGNPISNVNLYKRNEKKVFCSGD